MSMVVSQQKYDAMCDRMRSEMNYSSLTPEQKASFDRQLDNVMKEKGVVVDPAMNNGNNTEDENQNRDDRDNGIPPGKSDDDENTNDKSDESSNEDGPSHDDDDAMGLG